MIKICLSSKQTKEYLNKADEIMVEYKDRKAIIDLGHNYKAAIILDVPFLESGRLDWAEIEKYKVLSPGGFMLCLHTISLVEDCKAHEINFYLDFYIKTFYELEQVALLGPAYIQVDAPLFFQQDLVKSFNIPQRINPTTTNTSIFKGVDPLTGTWVRPEDIDLYNPCTVEFGVVDNNKEQALERFYIEKRHWPGQLNLIIPDFPPQILNRLISEELGKARLNCGQVCQIPSRSCHLCHTAMKIAAMRNEIADYLKGE